MSRKIDIWDQIKTDLSSRLSRSDFETWLSHTSLIKINPRLAQIEAPNKFIADWLSEHFTDEIQGSFKKILNTLPAVVFTHAGETEVSEIPENEGTREVDALFTDEINPLSTFDSFVNAASNHLAFSSALNVVNRPSQRYNPLYIFSELSLGKTHLLHAIANQVLTNIPSANIIYLSTERLVLDFSLASEKRQLHHLWEKSRATDLLILDDIHVLGDRRRPQEESLSLFSSFLDASKQLVVAANSPPGKIRNLLPQLRSRMEGGLIVEINVPDLATKMEIIRTKSKENDLCLPEDVTFFLANSTNNLKSLTGYVSCLRTNSSFSSSKIDISAAQSIINGDTDKKVGIHDIQTHACIYFNLSLTDLLSTKKGRKFSYPRQVAIYLSRKLTGLSFKEIGEAFGNRHHSTVINAVKRIEEAKSLKAVILNDINKLQKLLSKPGDK